MNNIIRFEERLYYGINESNLTELFNKGKNILLGIKRGYGNYYRPFSKYDELGNATMKHIEEVNKMLEFALTYDIQIEPICFYFVQL